MAVMTKVAAFTGVGLLSGMLPDGRRCTYYGGVRRIVSPPDESLPKEQLTEFIVAATAGVEMLRSRSDCEPADGAPLELTGCWDPNTGDAILMWRVPCVEIVKH
jgi:hypothetical protein